MQGNAMISPHESAITMAKDALNQFKHFEIQKLAQDTIALNTQENCQ